MSMMRRGRVVPFVLVFVLLIIGILPFSGPAGAAVLPDYDIRIDSPLVHLHYLEGNSGSMILTLVNQCFHQLTISVTTEGDGLMTQPTETTIILPNGIGASRNLSIAAALPYESPAGTYEISILTRIIRLDGAFIENGKERHARVIVLAHRHHDVGIETDHLQAVKGTAVLGAVVLENLGNAPDYFSLETATAGEITFLPAVDFMRADLGETIEYPVILIATNDAMDPSHHTIDVTVTSLCDKEFRMNRTIIIEVVDYADELETVMNRSGPGGMVWLSAVGLMMIFLWCIVVVKRSDRSPRSVSLVLFLSISMLTTILPVDLLAYANAQVVPEIEFTVEPVPELDISPLSPDEWSVGVFNMTFTDGEPEEHVIRCTVDAPGHIFGFVREHRVRSNGTITFSVTVAKRGDLVFSQSAGNVFIEIIERQGVSAMGTGSMQSGFFLTTTDYSLPTLSFSRTIIDRAHGRQATPDIVLTNHGFRNDGIRLAVEDSITLEEQGYVLSAFPDRIYLDRGEISSASCEVIFPKDLAPGITVMEVSATGESPGNNSAVGRATLVLLHGDDGGEDTELWYEHWQMIALPPLLIAIVLVVFVRRRRAAVHGNRSPSRSTTDKDLLEQYPE